MDVTQTLVHWSLARDGHTVVTDAEHIGGGVVFDGGHMVAIGIDPQAASLIAHAPELAQGLAAAVGMLHVTGSILRSHGLVRTAHEIDEACEAALDLLQRATGERPTLGKPS